VNVYDAARPVPNHGTLWTVDSLIHPEPWMRSAACATTDPDMFFPEKPAKTAREREAAAKAVCGGCPVRVQCLTYALEHGEEHGVWGGTSARERAAIRELRGAK
jgi:WhiB family redox-sensing transcriptional regulator